MSELSADRQQLLTMALAHLAVERPGWHEMNRDAALELGEYAGDLFDRFYAMRRARVVIDGPADSILQLRSAIERLNPPLWAMVAELAWPGGQP